MFYINFSCKCAWSEKCLIVRISKSTSVNHLIFSHTNKRKLFTCNLMIFLARWKPRIQIIFIPIWENTTIFPLKHSPLIWIRLSFLFTNLLIFLLLKWFFDDISILFVDFILVTLKRSESFQPPVFYISLILCNFFKFLLAFCLSYAPGHSITTLHVSWLALYFIQHFECIHSPNISVIRFPFPHRNLSHIGPIIFILNELHILTLYPFHIYYL